ncbi:MAG: flippase activity-associated protein Agl23 [Kofleriaceae bacterium]
MRKRVPILAIALVAVIALLAFGLRLWELELRAPHHDEGVNGWFVEQMRAYGGYYAYDPQNYHGPLYFYLLYAARGALGFGLEALRIPAAVIGALMCFLPLALRRQIGLVPATIACVLLATSPTLVYYARYAIHETLLAALGLGACVCAARSRGHHAAWLVGGAAAVAGMFVTKETAILFAIAVLVWLVVEVAIARRLPRPSARTLAIAAAMLGVFGAIWVVAFTGGFRSPDGTSAAIGRSLRAFALWQDTGETSGHTKPFLYYAKLGLRYELVLYVLAATGAIAARKHRVVRGFAIVGFVLAGGYSLIAYKMPWLPTSWLALLVVPAGVGAVAIAKRIGARWATLVGVGALALIATISVRSSFVHPDAADEDLAYVHTAPEFARWMGAIDAAAKKVGVRRIRIGVDDPNLWPLPYVLKRYPRVSWFVTGIEDVIIVKRDRLGEIEGRLKRRYTRVTLPFRSYSEPVVVMFAERVAAFAPH